MTNPFIMFSAPAHHIEFMRKHPGTAGYYREGEPPETPTITPKRLSWFDRLRGKKPEPPKARTTIFTTQHEFQDVATSVDASAVSIPAGFKEKK